MIKILHTGDVHLDAPFSSLNPALASQRRNDLRAAFTSMMAYAKMISADIILIAGDLFDGSMITRETLSMLSREFENFPGRVFIAPGNHDPASPKSIWMRDIFPKNVHVFTSESLTCVKADELGADIYGYAFTSPSMDTVPFDGKKPDNPERINILIGHCDTSSGSSCCHVTEAQLEAFGADYSALGHIHNPPQPEKNGRWSWCGCLEGRGFDECGPKGACTAEITKTNGRSAVSLRRVRFSKRRYEKEDLDVTGCQSHEDIAHAAEQLISRKKYGDDVLLSLRLTGSLPPSLMPDTDYLEKSITGLFDLTITDCCRPAIDTDTLKNDITVRGEVYRRLSPMLSSDDPHERMTAERAMKYVFAALDGDASALR